MRVLVTGHRGYIGSVMCPFLTDAGHDVVGLDTDYYANCSFGEGPAPMPGITGDIRDVIASQLRGFDAIIHLAALSNDPLGNLNPDITYDINERGTLHLAREAKAAGVPRFLFSSSCSNYGASGGDAMLTEESAFNPVTPYGDSKVKAELGLQKLADDTFSPVSLRSATAYGFSPRLRFDIVLNNLTAWAVAEGKIMIKSDGTPWRPIVHILDISRAFLAALEAPREAIHNQAFNVGRTDQNYRIREIAEIVKGTVPNCQVTFAADASPDTRNYRVDCNKISRVLTAFRPEWTAALGAKQLYQAYVQAGVQVSDFEGPRYKRIDQITRMLSDGRLDATLRWTGKIAAVAV